MQRKNIKVPTVDLGLKRRGKIKYFTGNLHKEVLQLQKRKIQHIKRKQ